MYNIGLRTAQGFLRKQYFFNIISIHHRTINTISSKINFNFKKMSVNTSLSNNTNGTPETSTI